MVILIVSILQKHVSLILLYIGGMVPKQPSSLWVIQGLSNGLLWREIWKLLLSSLEESFSQASTKSLSRNLWCSGIYNQVLPFESSYLYSKTSRENIGLLSKGSLKEYTWNFKYWNSWGCECGISTGFENGNCSSQYCYSDFASYLSKNSADAPKFSTAKPAFTNDEVLHLWGCQHLVDTCP